MKSKECSLALYILNGCALVADNVVVAYLRRYICTVSIFFISLFYHCNGVNMTLSSSQTSRLPGSTLHLAECVKALALCHNVTPVVETSAPVAVGHSHGVEEEEEEEEVSEEEVIFQHEEGSDGSGISYQASSPDEVSPFFFSLLLDFLKAHMSFTDTIKTGWDWAGFRKNLV